MLVAALRQSKGVSRWRVLVCQSSQAFSTSHAAYGSSKVYESAEAAVSDMKPNSTLLSGGFGLCGVPDTLIDAILKNKKVTDLTAVSNNAGVDGGGLGLLLGSGQVTKMISSYIGENKTFERMYLTGEMELDLTPQGTLAERIRAGGAGIPAFFTPAGVGTFVASGEIPSRYNADGTVKTYQKPKEARTFNGREYIMEEAIWGDYAIVKAYKADTAGNLQFRLSAENFNGAMARNAKITIVEAEHIVEPGEIDPNAVHVPGIYVDRIVQSTAPKLIEKKTFSQSPEQRLAAMSGTAAAAPGGKQPAAAEEAQAKRDRIVRRAAREFQDGQYVNLGIGMPMLSPSFLEPGLSITLQSENGILGLGPYPVPGQEDADLINAGKETVTTRPGASFFGSHESFGMIRAGRIDMTMLGAMQVGQFGDLANWAIPGKKIKGMGGAIDLCANPAETKIVVVMEHTSRGKHKIMAECGFPLTGRRCVSRIITDLCVFDVDHEHGLTLIEIAEGVTVEDVKTATEAPFKVSPNLKPMTS